MRRINSLKVFWIEKTIKVLVENCKCGSYISGAEVPIYSDTRKIQEVEDSTYIVEMEWIIMIVTKDIFSDDVEDEYIKKEAMNMIKDYEKKYSNLEDSPCIGVMYVRDNLWKKEIKPVVFVRETNTLFYETACGSGTCSVWLVESLKDKISKNIPIVQPSWSELNIEVEFNGFGFKKAFITGPAEQRRYWGIGTENTLSQIIELYKSVFSRAPYFEYFSDSEVKEVIYRTIEKSWEWRIKETLEWKVIAFLATLPFENTDEVSYDIKRNILWELWGKMKNFSYISELWVSDGMKKNSVWLDFISWLVRENKNFIIRINENNKETIELSKKLWFEMLKTQDSVYMKGISGESLEQKKVYLALIK